MYPKRELPFLTIRSSPWNEVSMSLGGNAKKGIAAEHEEQYIKWISLKPLRSALFPQMNVIAVSEWYLYFSADIYPSVAVGKGLILLCHLISGNHFSSVSMTFLSSVILERDLLCLWTAFCSEEWGYNCNVGRANWTCSGLSCLIFPCCFFFLCPLQLALLTGTFQPIKSWPASGLICF